MTLDLICVMSFKSLQQQRGHLSDNGSKFRRQIIYIYLERGKMECGVVIYLFIN
jgi:hypothetical protein